MSLASDYHPIEFPFKSHYLNWEDGKLHYVDEGKGPVLIFVHGHRSSSYVFRNLIKELMADYRCLALDFHGFGRSSAPNSQDYSLEWQTRQLSFWMKQLGIQEVGLITTGSGSIPALTYLFQQGVKPLALVMMHGWYWQMRLSTWQRIQLFVQREKRYWSKRFQLKRPERSLREDVRTAFMGFPTVGNPYPPSFHPTRVYGEETAWVNQQLPFLRRLRKTPSLLLWGHRNGRLRLRDLQRWEELLPHVKRHSFRTGRYLLLESHPEACARQIESFLRECLLPQPPKGHS